MTASTGTPFKVASACICSMSEMPETLGRLMSMITRCGWKSCARLIARGWQALAGFAFWKSAGDILHFRSALRAGAGAGELVGTLPEGFRPRSAQRIIVPTDGAAIATLGIDPAGRITVISAPEGATLFLDQVAVPVNGAASYVSGLY